MMPDYLEADACRCCGTRSLECVLDLGLQPLANSYLAEKTALAAYPLELFVCSECFHNQLGVAVDPDLMFRNYLYVSGTSRTLRDHFASFARDVLHWFETRPHRILDLACNDGTLLDAFRSHGCSVEGVDPASNLVQIARGKGLRIVEGFWPAVKSNVDGPFDIVSATNVLAHVSDPIAFLKSMLDELRPSGAAVLEFPYAREMVLHNEWDTIYHEHLSYFLAGPLLRMAETAGGAVTRIKRVPIHGGSLRVAIQRNSGGHCEDAVRLVEEERAAGLCSMATYQEFRRQVLSTRRNLVDHVHHLVSEGRRVVGYGASAKGNTALNYCRLPLAWIADDNPLKNGLLTPGQHIPIRPRESLAFEPPGLNIVLLAWNFAEEILGNIRLLRPGMKDFAIHYVPTFRVTPV